MNETDVGVYRIEKIVKELATRVKEIEQRVNALSSITQDVESKVNEILFRIEE